MIVWGGGGGDKVADSWNFFLFFSGWLDESYWTLKAIEHILMFHGKDFIVFPCWSFVCFLHHTNIIVKFADNTTIVDLISGGHQTAYRELVQRLVMQCSMNSLLLNTSKTKEMVMDWRKKRAAHLSLLIKGVCVGRVSLRFLDVHVSDDLAWHTNRGHTC